MLRIPMIALAATVALPIAAQATTCTGGPQDQWMSQDQAAATATALGYSVRQVKIEDGCYEVYAKDKQGNRVEAYLDPVTGAVVKTKIDD